MNHRKTALLLGILACLFLLRVVGQAVVAIGWVEWLPPMDQWYSGLIPYPVLLPIQIAILAMQAKVSIALWRNEGFYAAPHPRLGQFLYWASAIYFASMVLRYVLTMAYHPDQRWLGGTIPIALHWVLAGYLYVLACHFDRKE